MKTYRVMVTFEVFSAFDLEAEDEDDAHRKLERMSSTEIREKCDSRFYNDNSLITDWEIKEKE